MNILGKIRYFQNAVMLLLLALVVLTPGMVRAEVVEIITDSTSVLNPADDTVIDGASVMLPSGLISDDSGNLYIGDEQAYRVFKFDTATEKLYNFAGNGVNGDSGNNVPADEASFKTIKDLGIDGDGNIYVADFGSFIIRKINTSGVISTIAGTGTKGNTGDDGPATEANIATTSLAFYNGTLFTGEEGSGTYGIRQIPGNETISRYAGTTSWAYNKEADDGKLAIEADFKGIIHLAADSGGNIYIAESRIHAIRRINISDNKIYTIAGGNGRGSSGIGGSAIDAMLNEPRGIAFDNQGNLYFADTKNNRVCKIAGVGNLDANSAKSATITNFVGSGGKFDTSLDEPLDIAIDKNNNLYIADSISRVLKVTIPSTSTSTLGNINYDDVVDLRDAIMALQVVAGHSVTPDISGDVNDDDKIGLEEAIYVLDQLANNG